MSKFAMARICRGDIAACSRLIKSRSLPERRFSRTHNSRGMRHVTLGDIDRGISDFDKAIKANPNWEAPYIGRAVVKFMRGSSDGAIADLTSAIAINPNSAEAYVNRGVVCRVNGQIAKAISDFKMALKIDLFNEDAQFQLRELSIHPNSIIRHPTSSGSPRRHRSATQQTTWWSNVSIVTVFGAANSL
jgi:tetratricopeptide (TPR) repeat protein